MCPTGADKLALEWAEERGMEILKYPADWKRYKRAAGPIRNSEMGKVADALIAFWNGNSGGTKHMITDMLKRKKKVLFFICPAEPDAVNKKD